MGSMTRRYWGGRYGHLSRLAISQFLAFSSSCACTFMEALLYFPVASHHGHAAGWPLSSASQRPRSCIARIPDHSR